MKNPLGNWKACMVKITIVLDNALIAMRKVHAFCDLHFDMHGK